MLQLINMMMIFMINLLFFQLSHPLAMGLTLLIQTTLISIYSGMIFKNFWFAYVLFLTFMGGLLVLFIYVTSLASNEMFSFSIKTMLTMIITFNLILMTIYFMNPSMIYSYFKNNELLSINEISHKENLMELINLYKYPTNMITMLLILYLFLCLIVTVKITKMFYGPLRQMY